MSSTLKLILSSALSLVLFFAFSGCGGSGSGPTTPPPPQPTLILYYTPSPITVTPSESFFVTILPTESTNAVAATVALGALPAGITTTSQFPMDVPASGATASFVTSSAISPGSLSIPLTGTAGSLTASMSIPLTVVAGSPAPLFMQIPIPHEIQLAQGGSASINIQLFTDPRSSLYQISLSTDGLPAGVTAKVDPQIVEGKDPAITVTLSASQTAAVVHNSEWSIIATPAAAIPAASQKLLLDITTPAGGASWNNQTGYVSTRATPYGAVYDAAHGMIYAANETWNRIEVISDKTRSIVKSIPIRDPRGIDLSIDGSTVWVATGSQVMYGINTTTYHAKQYTLPRFVSSSIGAPGISWEGAQVLALADGTVLLGFDYCTGGCGSGGTGIWDPVANTLTQPASPVPVWGRAARSGDGTRVFSISGGFAYDVESKTYTQAASPSFLQYAMLAAANRDGSRVAVAMFDQGFVLLDGNLDPIGNLPGDGGTVGGGAFPIEDVLGGGFVFSPDGSTLYEETEGTIIPLIVGIDTNTRQVKSLSPAMAVIPVGTELGPPFLMPAPFAVDASGMVLGVQYHGIAFDDATTDLNFTGLEQASPTFVQHASVYSGPLSGGTGSSGFGNAFWLLPDVYYGATKGTASLTQTALTITSPPAKSAGPVDVKILFPDGAQVFNPQFFTYGTQIQDAVVSGGPPSGGVAAKLDAFGLPLDPSQDAVTVGGNTATVTSTVTKLHVFTGEQTSKFLSFTAPSGSPGWADLKVTNPNGSATLPKSFFYAQSVNDYATSDTPTALLYDKSRNRLYLSAGDHIDVFSTASNSFLSPLKPPSVGASKQFEGLALTPDGKYLLAADLSDFSLAAINPDNPSDTFVVPVAQGGMSLPWSCPTGPLFVAPDNLGNAYVVTGGAIGPSACGPGGYQAVVNLTSKTSALMKASGCDVFGNGGYVASVDGGKLIAIAGGGGYGGFQLYDPSLGICIPAATPAQTSAPVAAAADGNVIGLLRAFVSPAGDILGRFAFPRVFYPHAASAGYYNYSPFQDSARQNPVINDAGSLYVWAYPNSIDFVDVQHGMTTLRFGLTETVKDTVSPLAIDSSGQRVFLITDKGLTIVDLGNAPLSIGHLSQTSLSPGNTVQVRGSGFQSGTSATLGGKAATLTFIDPETLTLTVPVVGAGLQDLILTSPGGTTYVLGSAVTVQ